MWIPAKPKTFSQPNRVHGFIEFCTTMCRNNAVCVMKGPVRTNVGMSSQTIFISTLSLILNSDKDPRSHKDFISSDDLFSELLIDHLVWTHCVKVKHTHGCSPRQSCDHIGHQSKDWTARDVNQNSVRTYQDKLYWDKQVHPSMKINMVHRTANQTNTTFPTSSFIINMFCWLITQLSSY